MENQNKVEEKFSIWKFIPIVVVTFVISLGFVYAVSSRAVWQAQFHDSSWYWYALKFAIIFLVSQKFNCFVEWFFHRYMLHAPLVPGFSRMFRQHHDIHHRLTNIQKVPKNDKYVWSNNYAIMKAIQYVASFFPFYSYAGFLIVCSPLVVGVQLLLPSWPIALVVIISIGWSLTMYELIHAVEHFPMAFWESIFRKARWFRMEKVALAVYSFHENHHAGIKCNEAVSGFLCGLPVADLVFGTLKFSTEPLRHGKPVEPKELLIPRPYFGFIRSLDRYAERAIARYRRRPMLA